MILDTLTNVAILGVGAAAVPPAAVRHHRDRALEGARSLARKARHLVTWVRWQTAALAPPAAPPVRDQTDAMLEIQRKLDELG